MTVDVGVIGCGWWATRAHLPALARNPDARIAAMADPDVVNLERAAERFGVAARYPDWTDMLASERLDAAIVATPHVTHADIARACLEQGLHVLVEKPLTLVPSDAWDLVGLARTRDRELIVGYPYHYVPQLDRVRQRLREGAIGDVEVVVGLFASVVRELYRGHPGRYRDVLGYPVNAPGSGTYSDPRLAGGGQGQTQVTHLAALALWLTGLRPVAARALSASFELDVDLADACAIRFEDGAIGSFTSTGSVVPTQPEMLELRLFGSTGHVVVDASAGTALIHLADGTLERLPDTPPDQLYPEWAPADDLVRVAGGQRGSRSPGELGATVVALIDALYRSASTGSEALLASPTPRTAASPMEGSRA